MSRVKCMYVNHTLRGEIRWLDLSTGLCYHGEDSQMVGTSCRFNQVPTAPGLYREWVHGDLRLQECAPQLAQPTTAHAPTPAAPGAISPWHGFKADAGKPDFDLLMSGMPEALLDVVKVLSWAVAPTPCKPYPHGGKGYIPNSWKEVPEAKRRYRAALQRHENKLAMGEVFDEESGLPHRAHIATNSLFLAQLDYIEAKQNATI